MVVQRNTSRHDYYFKFYHTRRRKHSSLNNTLFILNAEASFVLTLPDGPPADKNFAKVRRTLRERGGVGLISNHNNRCRRIEAAPPCLRPKTYRKSVELHWEGGEKIQASGMLHKRHLVHRGARTPTAPREKGGHGTRQQRVSDNHRFITLRPQMFGTLPLFK